MFQENIIFVSAGENTVFNSYRRRFCFLDIHKEQQKINKHKTREKVFFFFRWEKTIYSNFFFFFFFFFLQNNFSFKMFYCLDIFFRSNNLQIFSSVFFVKFSFASKNGLLLLIKFPSLRSLVNLIVQGA